MTFNIKKRPLAFDADYGRANQVPRFTWSLPKCCSVEEGEAISQALELLNTQLRDHPELLLRIKINILKCSSAEEIYAEIASLAYLAKNHFEQFANLPFFSDILKIQIEERVQRIMSMHSEACGPHLMQIPSGGMHYLLTLFSQLLITDDLGISRMGIACMRRLLVHSKIPFYFEPQHYKHLNLVLDQFERNPNFLSAPINVHENLHKYCRIDLKFPEDKELNVLDFKRWVVQMFLTDIIQSDLEGNCSAISALKFAITNGFEELLDVLLSLLGSGYFYLNRQVRFDIATLMEGQCIRREDLSASLEHTLFLPPVLEEMMRTHHLNRSESALTVGSLLPNRHLQSVYSSYRRNLLQIILLHCAQLGAVNGSFNFSNTQKNKRDFFICGLVSVFLRTEELENFYGKILYNIFNNSIWLWDANPAGISRGEGAFTIDETTYPYEGSNPNRLENLLRHSRQILVVKGGNTIIIKQFTQLFDHLRQLIPEYCREAIFSQDLDPPTGWCASLKDFFLSFIDVKDFTSEDFCDICCLSQLGGNPSDALNALGQVAFVELPISNSSPIRYLESVQAISESTAPDATLIIASERHAFVTDVAKLQSLVFDDRPSEKISVQETVAASSNPKLLSEQMFRFADLEVKIPKVLERVGVPFDRQASQKMRKSYFSAGNYTLRCWAHYLRDWIITARLGVFEPEIIENALRAECGLPAIFCVADLNWVDPFDHRHCMLNVLDDQIFELWGKELYLSSLEFSNGMMYYPRRYPCGFPAS